MKARAIKAIKSTLAKFNRKRKLEPVIGKDYSLTSGERQVGVNLAEIRGDHVTRYELACNDMLKERNLLIARLGFDVFCGTGYGTSILAEALPCCIIGIDGSSEAIEYAEEHFGRTNNLFSKKLFPFDLPTASADFVICFESIEHVEDYEEFFKRLLNVLRKGGLMYLSVPNEAEMPFCKQRFIYHYRHFSLHDIQALADKHKVVIEGVWSQNVYRPNDDPIAPGAPLDHFQLSEGSNGQWLVVKIRNIATR
jgi:2-polyprenyl-3-methyl-5-hydroxy-6-metoxy-1,4-benzoquinol methylase